MKKYTRNSRVLLITRILSENPGKIVSLGYFSEIFGAAKSTISEDIMIVRETLEGAGEGWVETLAGASGGVRYITGVPEDKVLEFRDEIIGYLKNPERVVPGNFLYITDIMQNPSIISRAGAVIAGAFRDVKADYVITVETKGIPLAYETARYLGINLIVVRRNTRITEGTNVSINYLSGTQGLLSTMSLSKRAIKPGSSLIFIDDFMRGGGTLKGIRDLLKEFDSDLTAAGVMVDTGKQMIKSDMPFLSFAHFLGISEDGTVNIEPSDSLYL